MATELTRRERSVYTHQGSYAVHTYNTLLGFQTGGKLEYRFCRWTLDTHGNAGMFMNFARQDSRIQTSFRRAHAAHIGRRQSTAQRHG